MRELQRSFKDTFQKEMKKKTNKGNKNIFKKSKIQIINNNLYNNIHSKNHAILNPP